MKHFKTISKYGLGIKIEENVNKAFKLDKNLKNVNCSSTTGQFTRIEVCQYYLQNTRNSIIVGNKKNLSTYLHL